MLGAALGTALGAALAVAAAAAIWAEMGRVGYPTPSQPRGDPLTMAPPLAAAQADFGAEHPTPDQRRLADWIVRTADHGDAPFFIIDKPKARLLVFNGEGRLQGASSVLLGLALGDDTVPGIGTRQLADIRPEDRVREGRRGLFARPRVVVIRRRAFTGPTNSSLSDTMMAERAPRADRN